MRIRVIGSGSSGNVLYVEAADTRVLVDVGLSSRETVRRLNECQIDPASIDAVVLTHEHGDHARGVSVFARSYDVTGARVWTGIAEGAEAEVDAALERQRRFDPDLWIVEVEDREGRSLLDEPGLAD